MKVFCLGAAGRISRESALDLVQYSDFEKNTIGDYNYEEACKVAHCESRLSRCEPEWFRRGKSVG